MRHIIAARPVATLSRGVAPPSVRTVLVASSGALQRAAPGLRGTVSGTIDLAAVAAAADQRLGMTAGAQEQPRRSRLAVVGAADNRWTYVTIAGILAPHACPARCGARRRA